LAKNKFNLFGTYLLRNTYKSTKNISYIKLYYFGYIFKIF